jgi:hypothetical protein
MAGLATGYGGAIRSIMRTHRWSPLSGLAMALLLGAVPACRSRTADLGMSDSAFVLVMAELKAVADVPNVSNEVRAQRREAVLRKRAVTAAQLEKLTGELTAHPQHARRLWSAVEVKSMKMTDVKN